MAADAIFGTDTRESPFIPVEKPDSYGKYQTVFDAFKANPIATIFVELKKTASAQSPYQIVSQNDLARRNINVICETLGSVNFKDLNTEQKISKYIVTVSIFNELHIVYFKDNHEAALRGVLHDVNAGVGAVKGYVELRQYQEVGPEIEDLQDMLESFLIPGKKSNFNLQNMLKRCKIYQREGVGYHVEFPDETVNPTRYGKKNEIKRLLINLIRNAFNYTKTGSVSVKVLQGKNENHLIINITDTGCGMTKEQIEKIYKPKTARDPQGLNPTGQGVGLTNVHDLLIELGVMDPPLPKSEVGVGTTFTFEIKLEKEKALKAAGLTSPDLGMMYSLDSKILVVEDNPVNRMVLIRKLKQLGYKNIEFCSSYKEANEKLKEEEFKIVICDNNFDGEDETGEDLITKVIKPTGAKNANAKVYFFSSDVGELSKSLKELGVEKLLKPPNDEGLRSALTPSEKDLKLRSLDDGDSSAGPAGASDK